MGGAPSNVVGMPDHLRADFSQFTPRVREVVRPEGECGQWGTRSGSVLIVGAVTVGVNREVPLPGLWFHAAVAVPSARVLLVAAKRAGNKDQSNELGRAGLAEISIRVKA